MSVCERRARGEQRAPAIAQRPDPPRARTIWCSPLLLSACVRLLDGRRLLRAGLSAKFRVLLKGDAWRVVYCLGPYCIVSRDSMRARK